MKSEVFWLGWFSAILTVNIIAFAGYSLTPSLLSVFVSILLISLNLAVIWSKKEK